MLAQLEEVGQCVYEYLIDLPNGNNRWVSNHARLIKDEMGKFVRCDGVITDITASKQAEEDLLRVNRELELASTPPAIWQKKLNRPTVLNQISWPI